MNPDFIKYGPWAIAGVNLIGFLYLLYKDYSKSKKISNLELIVSHLKDKNEIIKNQGDYLKNIDCPIIDFYKSGYLIREKGNKVVYDFAIRYLNVGKRPATDFKYTIKIYEKKSNDFLELLNTFENESVNPVPHKNDIKIGHFFEKEKNQNDIFIKLNYSYLDNFDLKTNSNSVYYKMIFLDSQQEKGMFNLSLNEKKQIDSYKEN